MPTVIDEGALDRAAAAVDDGDLVVYPTETVYGLGADALDADAVERVFAAKGRDRSNPVSLAVPSVEAAFEVTRPTDREAAFAREFLPGPVTVVLERTAEVPNVLTAGRDRVGVRVPAYDPALSLLERTPPLTATSANVSGNPSARTVDDLDDEIRGAAAVVLDVDEPRSSARGTQSRDGGETPGDEGSTVVDVGAGEIHRRGARADAVESWLEERA
jgi:L-threonylcarbamoyladenylate synthase